MSVFIDVIIIGILGFFVIKYCYTGLLCAVLGAGKFIASVAAAVMLGKPLGIFISDNLISDPMTDLVYVRISENIVSGEKLSEFFNNIPEAFVKLVRLFGVDMATVQTKYATAEASDGIIRDMANTISRPISDTVSAMIAYVTIFIITLIVITLLIKALRGIKIPVLTGIDRLLGLCLGLIIGLLGASLVSTVVYTGLEFFIAVDQNAEIMNVYNDSFVFKYIYELRIFEFIRNLI